MPRIGSTWSFPVPASALLRYSGLISYRYLCPYLAGASVHKENMDHKPKQSMRSTLISRSSTEVSHHNCVRLYRSKCKYIRPKSLGAWSLARPAIKRRINNRDEFCRTISPIVTLARRVRSERKVTGRVDAYEQHMLLCILDVVGACVRSA